MTVDSARRQTQSEDEKGVKTALRRPMEGLLSYRLRCGHTANGLSHYYMYGDLEPEKTVL